MMGQVAQISHFVSPQYPPLARQAMISGQVTIKATVGEDGSVKDVSELSSAHPLLAQEAKLAIGEWKFHPGTAESKVTVVFYYGFSGNTRELNPKTTVKVDFEVGIIRVYITTDAFPAAIRR